MQILISNHIEGFSNRFYTLKGNCRAIWGAEKETVQDSHFTKFTISSNAGQMEEITSKCLFSVG